MCAYVVWLMFLWWIPEAIWRDEAALKNPLLNLLFHVWGILIVGIVAYPVGILSGCIGAVHILRKLGKKSTVSECFRLALANSANLWAFYWIDGWITVNQLLKRLPKKRNTNSVLKETLYFAWKLGTIGMLPGILSGLSLIDAGKDSVILVSKKTKDAVGLRLGYSLCCWIIGILAYIGGIFWYVWFGRGSNIASFYFLMAIPIMIAVSLIQVLLRPVYILASCELYVDFVRKMYGKWDTRDMYSRSPHGAFIVFLLTILLLVAFLIVLQTTSLHRALEIMQIIGALAK